MSSQTRPAPKPNRMTMAAIGGARKQSPDRILLYGTSGVGKTTWAASAPAPIFLPTERGLDDLGPEFDHVRTFPQPENFEEVLSAIRSLARPNEFKTFVCDSVDWMEPIIWRHLCQRNGWESIEAPGFQKGQIAASEIWRQFTHELERMQDASGMGVILLGHTALKTIQNPSGPDFARYELKMDKYGTAIVKEWTKSNFFAIEETFISKVKGERSSKVTSIGHRVMHTQAGPGWDAKNRHNLPPVLALDYAEYQAARDANRVASPEALEKEALELVAEWAPSPEDAAKFQPVFAAAKGDAGKLARIVDRLKTKVAEKVAANPEKESA